MKRFSFALLAVCAFILAYYLWGIDRQSWFTMDNLGTSGLPAARAVSVVGCAIVAALGMLSLVRVFRQ